MKATIILSLSAAIFAAGCSENSKELTNISQGMSKQQVIQTIGEPTRKNDLEVAELWVYPNFNKTLVFRADTVYDIVNSSTASIDSIKGSFKEFGQDISEGAKKIGNKLDTVGEKIEGKLDRDTAENNR